MNVPIFEFDGWTCTYSPRKGHTFDRDGKRIVVRPGAFPGQLIVQRTWLDRLLRRRPAAEGPREYGELSGGMVGGSGIELYPTWTPETRKALDGTAMRHDVGYFDAEGNPTMGDGKRYALTARKLPNGYERFDGAHYIRAYRHAVAQFAKDRDPFARMWLVLCAYDVMRRFPLTPFTDGEGPEYSLATMKANVSASPHSGGLGITRENAWALRCVVEAQRAAPSPVFRAWILQFVAMIEEGQSRNGAVERHDRAGGLQQGEPWSMFGLPDDVEVCVSWQTPFLVVALDEAVEVLNSTVPERSRGTTVIRHLVANILARIQPWWNDVPLVSGEDNSWPGLPRYLIVARGGKLVDRITEGVGPARPYYDALAKGAFEEYVPW